MEKEARKEHHEDDDREKMVSAELDMAYREDREEEEEEDDYADDFETFGEEAKSPTEVAE